MTAALFMVWAFDRIELLGRFALDHGNAFSPPYLLSAAAIGCVVWLVSPSRVGLLAFLFPRSIYAHRSTGVDIKLSILNFGITGAGFLSTISLSPLFAWLFGGLLRSETGHADLSFLAGAAVALALILSEDFGRFLNHYLHHKIRLLWPFHAVHHSAETLSPLTYWRTHPAYFAVQRLLLSALLGLVQGTLIAVAPGRIDPWVYLVSANAYTLYFLAGGHLRHSHIWVSYGSLVERILISPAQHQIHHSINSRHQDKNFGEIFAIWDWLFGTLYLTHGKEELQYGLADASGGRLEQLYSTLWQAIFLPFRESGALVLAKLRPQKLVAPAADLSGD